MILMKIKFGQFIYVLNKELELTKADLQYQMDLKVKYKREYKQLSFWQKLKDWCKLFYSSYYQREIGVDVKIYELNKKLVKLTELYDLITTADGDYAYVDYKETYLFLDEIYYRHMNKHIKELGKCETQ